MIYKFGKFMTTTNFKHPKFIYILDNILIGKLIHNFFNLKKKIGGQARNLAYSYNLKKNKLT